MRRIALILMAASTLGFAPWAAAQGGDLARRREAAYETLGEQLESYAKWCQSNRLFAERNAAYIRILELDPEHAEARRVLGFKKKKGRWVAPKKPKAVRNFDADALRDAPDQLAEAVRPAITQLLAILEGGSLRAAETERIQLDILSLAPNNRYVRDARGEVEWNGDWVLRETATGARRRAELGAIVRASFRSTPDTKIAELNAKERAFGLGFDIAITPEVRVLSTGGANEGVSVAKGVHAARETFDELFGRHVPFPPKCTVYLLANDGEMLTFLNNHPVLDEAARGSLAQLQGAGIPTTADWAFWKGNEAQRADGIVRMAFGYFLLTSFSISTQYGWAHEGLGLYMTKALVGTRMTWFIDWGSGSSPTGDPREAFAMRSRLLEPSTNWMSEAREILSASPPPDLRAMFRKTATALSVQDLVCAYAIVAYLVEGYSEEVATRLFTLTGRGIEAERAFDQVLGMELSSLPNRVARWIRETSAEEFRPPIVASRLTNEWDALGQGRRERAIKLFREKLASVKSRQLALIRAHTPDAGAVLAIPSAPPLEYFDPKKHASAQPIPRAWLEPDHSLVRDVHNKVFGPTDPRALITSFEYDWSDRRLVRTSDPNDLETVFANAANGYAPGLDLAIATIEQKLDDGAHQDLNAAFDHVYTDRDGGVYPDTTLYDVWTSDLLLEMPDIDALGILHDAFDDWESWIAPIPASEHERLYSFLSRHYQKIRRHRTLRSALAHVFFVAEPTSSLYLEARTNLHALWADADDKPAKIKKHLPDQSEQEDWFRAWVDHCYANVDVFDSGERRRSQLIFDSDRVVRALADAIHSVK